MQNRWELSNNNVAAAVRLKRKRYEVDLLGKKILHSREREQNIAIINFWKEKNYFLESQPDTKMNEREKEKKNTF